MHKHFLAALASSTEQRGRSYDHLGQQLARTQNAYIELFWLGLAHFNRGFEYCQLILADKTPSS